MDENQQLETARALLNHDIKRLRAAAAAQHVPGFSPADGSDISGGAQQEGSDDKGGGRGGVGATADDVDLFAGGEVTGMEE